MTTILDSRPGSTEQATFEQAWMTRGILAVTAASNDDLDQWGRGFARYVRSRRGSSLEIYLPSTREALIDRFNEMLRALSVERARAEAPAESPGRVILVPDVRAFDSPEGHLLSRLVTDFPGAATRLVLLIDPTEWARSQPHLSTLGRQVQRMDISSRKDPDRTVDLPKLDHAPLLAADDRAGSIGGAPLQPPHKQPMIDLEVSRRPSFSWLGAGALVTALLLISALIVVLLHRERGPGAGFEPRSAAERSKESVPPPQAVVHSLIPPVSGA